MYIFWQFLFLLSMREDVMRHVDEIRAACPYPIGEGDGILDGLMAWMLLVAKSVDHKGVDTLQLLELGVRDGLHVGDVGKVLDAIAHDRQATMHDAYRNDLHFALVACRCLHGCQYLAAAHGYRTIDVGLIDHIVKSMFLNNNRYARLNGYEIDGWDSGIAHILRREAIGHARHEMVDAELLGIDVDVAKDAERTKIVKTTHMVIVLVGDEYCVQGTEIDRQHLLTEVGTAIDKDALAMHIDDGRATQSPVARVAAGAHFAWAAYLWHSARCACSKYRNSHTMNNYDNLLIR